MRRYALGAVLVVGAVAGCAVQVEDHEAAAARIESSLKPTVVLEGQEVPRWTLAERMDRYRVPGVALAVVRSGEIDWVKGYGVLEAGGSEPVTPETLFQAASLSKPVSAAGALTMVEAGLLGLDDEVNESLTTWKVPGRPATMGEASQSPCMVPARYRTPATRSGQARAISS